MPEVVYRFDSETHTGREKGTAREWLKATVASWNACCGNSEREACGYVENGMVVQTVNDTSDGGRFRFTNTDAWLVWQLYEAGVLQGIWHSHPLGHREPSEEDWAGHPRGLPMYIVVLLGHDSAEVIRYGEEDRP